MQRLLGQLAVLKRQVAVLRREQLANPRLSATARPRVERQVATIGAQARTLAASLPAGVAGGGGASATPGAPATSTGPGTPASGPAPVPGAAQPAASLTASADQVAAEIDASRIAASAAKERFTKAGGVKGWLDRVVALHQGLTTDPEFVLGRSSGGRPTQEVGSPSLAQIADVGFFATPGVSSRPEAFGEDFVLAATQRGFTPGASWEHPDSMHFELRRSGGS